MQNDPTTENFTELRIQEIIETVFSRENEEYF